jgi:hypothetical protein
MLLVHVVVGGAVAGHDKVAEGSLTNNLHYFWPVIKETLLSCEIVLLGLLVI